MGGVHIDGSVVPAWEALDQDLYLLFVTDPPFDWVRALEQVECAARAAVALDPEEAVAMQGASPTPRGPVVHLDWLGGPEERDAWLAALVVLLGEAGWSGTVVPADDVNLNEAAEDALYSAPGIGAFLSVAHDTVPWGTGRGWGVSPQETRMLMPRLAEWVADGASELVASLGSCSFSAPAADVAGHLVWGCEHGWWPDVEAADGMDVRRLSLTVSGGVVASSTLGDGGWRAGLEIAREALLCAPAATDLGFVRRRTPAPRTWEDADDRNGGVLPPFVSPTQAARARDTASSWILDVHGMQLLTDEHLSKVRSLAGWTVEEVATHRYLVVADDLDAWYANTAPDPAALAEARDAFADVLLVDPRP